jgi:predicted Zn-dependent protease
VVRHEGRVYRFIFAAKFDSPGFAKAASETLKSFRATSQRDLSAVKHLVIRTVTAGSVDTADSLARKMAGLSRGTDLFYILNNLYPGDTLKTGQKYKIVSME